MNSLNGLTLQYLLLIRQKNKVGLPEVLCTLRDISANNQPILADPMHSWFTLTAIKTKLPKIMTWEEWKTLVDIGTRKVVFSNDLAFSLDEHKIAGKEVIMFNKFLDISKDGDFFSILNREIHGWEDRVMRLSKDESARLGMHLAAGLASLLPYFMVLEDGSKRKESSSSTGNSTHASNKEKPSDGIHSRLSGQLLNLRMMQFRCSPASVFYDDNGCAVLLKDNVVSAEIIKARMHELSPT
jgi:hypothetical protein